MTQLLQVIFVVWSDGPFGAGDVCFGPEILDQPDEVPVAIRVEEFRP